MCKDNEDDYEVCSGQGVQGFGVQEAWVVRVQGAMRSEYKGPRWRECRGPRWREYRGSRWMEV